MKKIQLLTDGHDREIAKTFYVQKLNARRGTGPQWGVFAQDFDCDAGACIAIVHKNVKNQKLYAECLAQALEENLRSHVAYENGEKLR